MVSSPKTDTGSLGMASSLKTGTGRHTSFAFRIRKRKGHWSSSLRTALCLKRVARSITNSSGGGGTSSNSYLLPEELLEEILVRLPAKSIVRFKSVCKTWLFLFSSRLFIDLHRSCIRCDNSLTVHSSTWQYLLNMAPQLRVVGWPDLQSLNPRDYISLNYKDPGYFMCAYGPLDNGIYGLTSLLGEKSAGRYCLTGKISFCNPATHVYKFINPFPQSLLSGAGALKPYFVNFGFGSVRQDSGLVDYKVVAVISCKPFGPFICLVYSLQSGEWRRLVNYELLDIGINNAFHLQIPLLVSPRKSDLEGCWHWLAMTKPPHDQYNQPFQVLSFGFADERFKIIGGPSYEYDSSKYYVKGEVLAWQDHLVVICVKEEIMFPWCDEINAWMMMEYGVEESWTVIYKIQHNYYGRLSRLVGIYPCHVRNEESGIIHIEKLSFEDYYYHKRTIIFNKNGFEVSGGCKSHFDIDWNIAGISTYMETLEPLGTCSD